MQDRTWTIGRIIYDDFGQLVTDYQEHGGAVNTGTSLKVQYAYADGSSNTIRLTKMTYPDGRELNYSYGSSGSTDDALSRVASLIDDDGSTHLVDYSYLGGRLPLPSRGEGRGERVCVKVDCPEPDLRYDLAMGAGDDPYDGFDRFGRIVDSRWYDYGSSADVDRILYGYDRASNRTYREQTCDPTSYHDEVYGHDGLNRLTDFDRGTINGNKDAISTLKFAQQWSLDPTGNWSGFKEDDDGNSSWDLEQTRTSNAVNEITDIAETSGSAWITPAYNRAGNMTTIPKPADPTNSFAATYDAWNRLVKLEEGEDTLSEYAYDAAKRRVIQKTYDSGLLDQTHHFYYTDPKKWQVIEERLESSGTISANPDRQFVWGLHYIDDLVLRDRDTDSNGTLDERLYALQDANWNVTALADSSGDVQERYAYSAYGTPFVLTPTFTTRGSSIYEVDVLYAGYRYDQATGLYHVRHRMYQPELGCWVQRDPIRFSSRVPNLQQYVGGSPTKHVDAQGLEVAAPPVIPVEPVIPVKPVFPPGWQPWEPPPYIEPQPSPNPLGCIIRVFVPIIIILCDPTPCGDGELKRDPKPPADCDEEKRRCREKFPSLPICPQMRTYSDRASACGRCNMGFYSGRYAPEGHGYPVPNTQFANAMHYNCLKASEDGKKPKNKDKQLGDGIICGSCCIWIAGTGARKTYRCKCAVSKKVVDDDCNDPDSDDYEGPGDLWRY